MPELKLAGEHSAHKYELCYLDYYVNTTAELGDLCLSRVSIYSYGKLRVNKEAILNLKSMTVEGFYRIYDGVCSPCIKEEQKIRLAYYKVVSKFLQDIEYGFDGNILRYIVVSKNRLDEMQYMAEVWGDTVEYYTDFLEYTYLENMFDLFMKLLSLHIYSGHLMYNMTDCYYQADVHACTNTLRICDRGKVRNVYVSSEELVSLYSAQQANIFANIPYSDTIVNIIDNRF